MEELKQMKIGENDIISLRWDIPVVCVNIKHDVGDSQNTTDYLFAKCCCTR